MKGYAGIAMTHSYKWSTLEETPLVSCIMPTYGRPQLVPESVEMFLSQDYPRKELIIINDCPDQIYNADLPDVRIFNLPKRMSSLGAKRDWGIKKASGSVLAVWDDDDVYLPWRLSYSIEKMQKADSPFYLSDTFWAYWGEDQLHHNSVHPGWPSHGMALYFLQLYLDAGGYPDMTLGEDAVLFDRLLKQLNISDGLPTLPTEAADRVMVMRCKSHYEHTSIGGGSHPADTTPQTIELVPRPIEDALLRRDVERLIQLHRRSASRYAHRVSGTATLAETHLDDLRPAYSKVGHGQLGINGDLGYEGKRVEIGGRRTAHALSAHAPSELHFELDGSYDQFSAEVAINDDVSGPITSADFQVLVDGKLAAIAHNVCPGGLPRRITANVRGARNLTLIARAHRFPMCHTVWVDPQLLARKEQPTSMLDPFGRANISLAETFPPTELCIATVGSVGFESWIDDLFGSIRANGGCDDAQLALFFYGDTTRAEKIAGAYDAWLIPCEQKKPLSGASKSVLYSAGHVLPAQKFICLDADMLVLESLQPLVGAMACQPKGSIFSCREAAWADCLGTAIKTIYGGQSSDIGRLLCGFERNEASNTLVINDGIFAGTVWAIRDLDQIMRSMVEATAWIDEGVFWRAQFVCNLALASLGVGVELAPSFNAQLNCQSVDVDLAHEKPRVTMDGNPVSILHFNGGGRNHHPELRGRYCSTPTQ